MKHLLAPPTLAETSGPKRGLLGNPTGTTPKLRTSTAFPHATWSYCTRRPDPPTPHTNPDTARPSIQMCIELQDFRLVSGLIITSTLQLWRKTANHYNRAKTRELENFEHTQMILLRACRCWKKRRNSKDFSAGLRSGTHRRTRNTSLRHINCTPHNILGDWLD